jgi:hypothetical protein
MSDKQHWLSVLEAASQQSPDQMNEEWAWLMRELGLPAGYFLAVLATLEQGRWRHAKNPKSYVKTVARREAVKLGLLDRPSGEVLEYPNYQNVRHEDVIEDLIFAGDSSYPLQGSDGVWRGGSSRRSRRDAWEYEHDTLTESLMSVMPPELTVTTEPNEELRSRVEVLNNSTQEFHIHLKSKVLPDWTEWAERAGLDEWEQTVIRYRRAGVSRERAIADQVDERSKKALQAAWRKFDRTGMKRLREVVKKVAK